MKMKLKIYMLLALMLILTGCGNTQKEQSEPNEILETELENNSNSDDNATVAINDEENENKLWQEDMKSCLILEDEDNIYVCGTYKLLKINKESKKEQVLWENDGDMYRDANYLYSEGSGLLLNDKIYFLEAWTEDDGETENKALAVIGTDGLGYQRIEELSGSRESSMLLVDGILYVDGEVGTFSREVWADGTLCYEVLADGTLSEPENIDDMEAYKSMPEAYSQISYYDNGRRTFFAARQLKDLGYLILRNEDYDLVKIVPETGEEISLSDKISSIEAYNDQYLLTSEYNDGWEWYLADKETLDKKFLTKFDDNIPNIIAMDEEYVYTELENVVDEKVQYIYKRVSLKTGEQSVIFKDDSEERVAYYSPEYLSDMVLKNGYLYYVGTKDYKLYLMRRNLENPSREEILGEAFYDSGISHVGTIEEYHSKIYSKSNPDIMLVQTDLEWLHVDERFKGAEEINRCLTKYQEDNIAYEESNVEWLEEDAEEYGEYIIHCSYSSTVSEIAYFDEKYLSFCQQDYDYTGGAHGMPFRIGFTFDLETGQKLELKDIIGNSEEELKETVTKYFEEYIGKNPENFWEGAVDSVRESTNFDSRFYLTDEGIKFYFYPYALASYAAGFPEVTIPYEEFEMKIGVKR